MKQKTKLLFVCLGNICRSPAAQAIMEHIIDREGNGPYFEIDSAGIGDWHVGQLPDSRMIRHGKKYGYVLNHHARQFCAERDFGYYDYIFVMDAQNHEDLYRMTRQPSDCSKIKFLAEFLQHHPHQHDIPDPYYGDEHDFDFAIELLEDACEALYQELIQKDSNQHLSTIHYED